MRSPFSSFRSNTDRSPMRTEPLYNKPRPPHAIEKPPEAKPKPKATSRAKLGSRDLREDRGTRQIKNTQRPGGPHPGAHPSPSPGL
jgi:hypothetical protein